MTLLRAVAMNGGTLVGLNPAQCPEAQGENRPPAATTDQEEPDTGLVMTFFGLAHVEGACCFLQGVQSVPP